MGLVAEKHPGALGTLGGLALRGASIVISGNLLKGVAVLLEVGNELLHLLEVFPEDADVSVIVVRDDPLVSDSAEEGAEGKEVGDVVFDESIMEHLEGAVELVRLLFGDEIFFHLFEGRKISQLEYRNTDALGLEDLEPVGSGRNVEGVVEGVGSIVGIDNKTVRTGTICSLVSNQESVDTIDVVDFHLTI
jgi:hypothetical protein